MALLSRSATWSLIPSISGLGDLVGDLLGDLDLDDLLGLDLDRDRLGLDLDLLLDLGLPVLDLVLALESGDPDFDLVLALSPPEADLERLLPLIVGVAEGARELTSAVRGAGALATAAGLDTDILRQVNILILNS